MANFWTSPNRDPKRAYRFTVSVSSFEGGGIWYAKSATKPKFTVTSTEHKYINHTFHYPGRVEWDPVTITIVDPVDPNAASTAAEILQNSGYYIPGNENAPFTTVNKKDAIGALGRVTIRQIGESDTDILEEWVLNNAWIEGVNFSDLSYDDEELSTIELSIKYDWASLKTKEANGDPKEYFLTTQTPTTTS
tara:strand:- start:1254 stop:1829 length:576 start_codon:yes stop_codon:yes gene_type:complete